jgi:hypothetical protein
VESQGEPPKETAMAIKRDAKPPVLSAPKPAVARSDSRIVPDAKWPNMYRIRLPGGGLSDMVNLTRAKDALFARLG